MGFYNLGLRSFIEERERMVVVMKATREECLNRIRPGKFDGIPFPYNIPETEMICTFDERLKKGYLKKCWGKYTLVESDDISPVLKRLGKVPADSPRINL